MGIVLWRCRKGVDSMEMKNIKYDIKNVVAIQVIDKKTGKVITEREVKTK